MKIHLVWGDSGAYSDHRSWVVKAFTNADLARTTAETYEALAEQLNQAYEFQMSHMQGSSYKQRDEYDEEHPDPMFRCGWDKTRYHTQEIELVI